MITSACFPIARRTWQHASAEPTASPSGRACDVNTNRSCCPICRSTSSSMSLRLLSTCVLWWLRTFLGPLQQFLDARFGQLGAVKAKIQFRSASDAEAFDEFVADILASGFEAFETAVCLDVIAFDINPDFGRTTIIRHVD